MTDEKNWGPQDTNRVNVYEDNEVRYWTDKFGVSAAELRDAVSKAGYVADAVEKELKRRKR